MQTTPAPSAAAAARPASPVPAPPRRHRGRWLRRLAAAALAAACAGLATPATAGEPARPREPAGRGGALLLLSFLIPMPLPMALVASPQATRTARPPPDPCTGSRRQPGCVATRRADAR